ncbi:MAG: hypothetical protein IPK78_18975 [Rhodospirillales bacterium]|nr:hypothetical protein [Rhodospirillales bacterium]
MTQANDLGAIANQLAAFYRARVNVNMQALATQHYGASEPAIMYPNMIWFDAGTGNVKLRNPTNSSWATIGTIGPPMKWTNVDIPQTAFTTGDVKQTYKVVADAGWVLMNDGSIGDGSSGATTRANPDTQALFTLLWNVTSDSWCTVYAASTLTATGRGASAAADWAAHRHILLPKALGRVFGHAGAGAGLGSFGLATWWGQEYVGLGINNMPAHPHSFAAPDHGHPYAIDPSSQSSWNSSGAGGFPTGGPGATKPAWAGAVGDGNDAHIIGGGGGFSGNTGSAGGGEAHFNIQPTSYLNVMIKL